MGISFLGRLFFFFQGFLLGIIRLLTGLWTQKEALPFITPFPRLGQTQHYAPRPLLIRNRYLPPDPPVWSSAHVFPTISIVCPSLGYGNFIERTIKSVVTQKYPGAELIVSDGGSKDHTVSILNEYDALIKFWSSEKDEGQTDAINKGFVHATGDIMAYLNADDVLLPGALWAVAEYFRAHPDVDVVYGHRVLIDENDNEIGRWIMPPHTDAALSWIDYIPQETLFWRREIWEKAGGSMDQGFRFAMDWDLLLRLRDAGARFARIPRFLGAFRIHTQQKTSSVMDQIGQEEIDHLRLLYHGQTDMPLDEKKRLRAFLIRHVICHLLYSAGLVRY